MSYVVIILLLIIIMSLGAGYIDPGTGSMIVGSLWPFIVASISAFFAYLARRFWYPLKNFFYRMRGGKGKSE